MAAEGSSTAKYCTATNITNRLPSSLPSGLDSTQINTFITNRSRYIDARLPNYISFPATTDTPATPKLIEDICINLVLWDCHGYIGTANMHDPASQARFYLDKAEADLEALRNGDAQIAREAVTSEELTYGTGTMGGLTTSQAELAKQNVIHETIEIVTPSDATRYGVDYRGFYSPEHRKDIYEGLSSLGQDATHVSYEYTYLKLREVVKPQIGSGALVRG